MFFGNAKKSKLLNLLSAAPQTSCHELLRPFVIFPAPARAASLLNLLSVRAAQSLVRSCPDHLSDYSVLAVAEMRRHALEDLRVPAGTPPLFLVAESVEKPGNLGALLRTADSVGCTALICCGDAGTDVYNPNAIRASQGALFTVPLAVASAEAARDWLEARGVTIFAAAPAAEKIYWDCDFRGPAAILAGAEATGLTDFWLGENAARDSRIVPAAIPQRGAADSLNVATAAAVFLFEALRQRSRR